jgi:hypothetical protein
MDGGSTDGVAGGSIIVTSGTGESASGGVTIATHSMSSTTGDAEVKNNGGVATSGRVRVASLSAASTTGGIAAMSDSCQRQQVVGLSAARHHRAMSPKAWRIAVVRATPWAEI